MREQFIRTEKLLGEEILKIISKQKILLFGVGGVGGYIFESLVRSGIENIDIVDGDIIAESNINRQIIATHETIGRKKVEVAKERIKLINDECVVNIYDKFILPENINQFDFNKYDYIIDAIDTITTKIAIINEANIKNKKIISAMGAGNRINPLKIEVSDIYKTTMCPLAKIMRKELKKINIKQLKVVYSKEEPIVKTTPPASISFVPATMGLVIASEVIKDIINEVKC